MVPRRVWHVPKREQVGHELNPVVESRFEGLGAEQAAKCFPHVLGEEISGPNRKTGIVIDLDTEPPGDLRLDSTECSRRKACANDSTILLNLFLCEGEHEQRYRQPSQLPMFREVLRLDPRGDLLFEQTFLDPHRAWWQLHVEGKVQAQWQIARSE